MKMENWPSYHVHVFNYFGGVARLQIPDNYKTATVSNTRYETFLNRSYPEYYGTAIVPARVRSPPEQGYKACVSLTKLGVRCGRERLENACGRILTYSSTPSV